MTGEGLESSGEFNPLARLPRTAPQVRRLVAEFDHLWSTRTVPLSPGRIKHYASIRPRRPRATLPQRSLAGIFGPASSDGVGKSDASSESVPRYWRDWISGFAAARTEVIVTEETDWDRNRYWWYASQYAGFETGDRILLQPRYWLG